MCMYLRHGASGNQSFWRLPCADDRIRMVCPPALVHTLGTRTALHIHTQVRTHTSQKQKQIFPETDIQIHTQVPT